MTKKLSSGKFVLLYMTIIPVIFVLLFSYLPLFGWSYAFFDYRIGYKLFNTAFVGLSNFKYAFGDPYLLTVLLNTIVISFLSMLGIPLAAAIAIFLSEMRGTKYKKFVQTAITLPNFISWVIIYSISFALFSQDGLINNILLNAGWIVEPLNVLSNKSIAWFFQSGLSIWKSAGYSSIIFFAAIAGIDTELYDAADVDGAKRIHKIRYITLPGIMTTVRTILLIQVGFMLSNGFDQYYVFMNPIIQPKIEVLDYYVYRIGLLQNDMPVSAAVSMCKTFVSVTLLFALNSISRKSTDSSIL